MNIHIATLADAERLAALVAECLAESYAGHPGSSAATLSRDVLAPPPPPAPQPRVAIAVDRTGNATGYLAWDATYDMHWGLAGAHVSDLYVAPSCRGLGAALSLVAFGCAEVLAAGGSYMRGEAYDRSSTRKFYSRFAVIQSSGEVALGGRAFRHIASLSGLPAGEILASLPPVEWNFEP